MSRWTFGHLQRKRNPLTDDHDRMGESALLTHLQHRTDELTAVYLLVTASLMVLFREEVAHWSLLFCLHLITAASLLWLRSLSSPSRRSWKFLHDWYPVMVFPLFYKEVEFLAAAFGNWGLTEPIRSLEANLFQGHPSLYLSERWSWVPLSEYLHFCYFSFMVLLPVVGGYWYGRGHMLAFRELLFLVGVAFYGSYLFFILFPVDSPFYLADPTEGPIADYFFYNLVHEISSRGGARGGAFPSTHVSASIIVLMVAWKRQRRLAYLLLPMVLGVIVATVYGRFHYVLDTIAGLALGVVITSLYLGLASRGEKPPLSLDDHLASQR